MRERRRENGIALLISIFILLLISVVAIALIVSSGTESALAGNYRSATGVYYAALAGLEEARGRLLAKNPNAFKITNPTGFLPASGTPLNIGDAYYVINPVPGETVAPWDVATITTYPDIEFGVEFASSGYANPPNPSPSSSSVSTVAGIQGPLFKWVRINAISETSLGLQVAPYDGHSADPTKPIFYDSTIGTGQLNITPTGSQVLEITSLAVLPNGSQKLLQYLTAPVPITLPPFLAALTLSGSAGAGNGAVFSSPSKNTVFYVSGENHYCNGSVVAGSAVAAIGVLNGSDVNPVINGGTGFTGIQPSSTQTNYKGRGSAPDVEDLNVTSPSFPPNLLYPSHLDAIAQSIVPNADAVVPSGSSATQTAYLSSLGMSSANPMTVVAGDLDISNWSSDGYGLLLVTGKFTYDPDTNWYGIILVIGQGTVGNLQNGQYKQINGAMFVAKTRNPSGGLLPDPPSGGLGGASVKFDDDMQGNGIRYSSCWIQKAQATGSYKILSFHEISQP